MATRLQITLDGAERSALNTIAEIHLREPAAQVRFILRQELKRQGYLLTDEKGQIGDMED